MFCFETCPYCSQRGKVEFERLVSMVLSRDDREMQCGTCNQSFKLPDSEVIRKIARQQKEKRHVHIEFR